MATFPEPADAPAVPSLLTEPSGGRHRAPEEDRPDPLGGPRHRLGNDEGQLRVAEDGGRWGRHAAPEDDDVAARTAAREDADPAAGLEVDEDPYGWLGFRFEAV